ncbi:restriction endonuclease [Paenibacillus sp. 19GGS1-52]|uniref:restriction endonuclease n=1 Tax=Paenibacillus sp. 19GGS1-52 TaxID=2758563 RepID=UPI001EFB75BE|nr:restriction endonuclease [Paenibacillus sp. 19GGS1-52]ULO04853.1 restriction endonuclease [Paenibacillus sp. 19GGS1-52]
MYFSEDDINFDLLTSSIQFEELSYDLLSRQGFHTLKWRQGGADNGRDIEALYTTGNPLTGPITEKWFIECKYYTNGVPLNEISTKFDWASVEWARHLVVITSSYLTTATRSWVDLRMQHERFLFHLIEGKQLKSLILQFPDIVIKYFKSESEKLLIDLIRSWTYHNVLPNRRALSILIKDLDYTKLTPYELSFLSIASAISTGGLDYASVHEGLEERFDSVIEYLIIQKNHETDVFPTLNVVHGSQVGFGSLMENEVYTYYMKATLTIDCDGKLIPANLLVIYNDLGEGVEVVLYRNHENKTIIRHINEGSEEYAFSTSSILIEKFH